MTPAQLQEAIARGGEQGSVEFKAGGPRTDDLLFSKVLRAMLAMANRRDGGVVVLGVAETDTGLVQSGVVESDLRTWTTDHLADSVAPYADPHLEFDVHTCELDSKQFVVITVKEFSDTPVLCKKQFTYKGKVVLSEGACYVRSRRKPESVAVATYPDMRDLLDLAAVKALRRFLGAAHSAGAHLVAAQTDSDLFRAQLGDLDE